MADIPTNPTVQTLEAPSLPPKTEVIKPGATVEDIKKNVEEAMKLLDIPEAQNQVIAGISDTVQKQLAQAAPESTDDAKTINTLFLGILSVKKLLEHEDITSQYGELIKLWEKDLNDPSYKRDALTIQRLKDLLRSVQEEAREVRS